MNDFLFTDVFWEIYTANHFIGLLWYIPKKKNNPIMLIWKSYSK